MKKVSDAELKQKLGDYVAPPGLYQLTKDMPFLGKVSCNVESIVAGSWQEIVIDYELGASGMPMLTSVKKQCEILKLKQKPTPVKKII